MYEIKWNKTLTKHEIFFYCSAKGVQTDEELKWQFKLVLPLCDACKAKGKKAMKRGPINTAKARKAGKNQ